MTDLQRLVALIATNLAASDPGRLHRPIPIAELMERILPYRSARRQLGLVTTEEYELLILRLAAGEEGLARTEPADTLARFRLELDGVHPDLHVLTIDESAAVVLSRDAVARAREGGTGQAYAPPGSAPAKPVQPHATEATQPDPAAQARPAPLPGRYETVLTTGELERWCELIEAAPLVSLDTETTSLAYMRAELVGISLAVTAGEAAFKDARFPQFAAQIGSPTPRFAAHSRP